MGEITTIGLDLAKSVFQVHAVGADGKVVLRRQLRRNQVAWVFRRTCALPDRHGGLCVRRGNDPPDRFLTFLTTLLGAGTGQV